MSGLYLLVLIAIWLFIGWVAYRIWKRWNPADLTRKVVHIIIGVLIFSIWFGGAFWEVAGKKMYWDAKVRELCAIDGGVKVYETVALTPDLIDKFGRIRIPSESKARVSDLYIRRMKTEQLRDKNPSLTRTEFKIIRCSDGKVLGKSVGYGRSGGGISGPWESSYFLCPDPTSSFGLSTSIFVKETR